MSEVLLALTQIGCRGGIQSYNRHLVKAIAALAGNATAVSLLDAEVPQASESQAVIVPCAGNKRHFVVEVLRRSRNARATIIGHINLSPVALAMRAAGRRGAVIGVIHGIEAWRRETGMRRFAMSRMNLIASVSE